MNGQIESGTVTLWFHDKGYGFLRLDSGGQIFSHVTEWLRGIPDQGLRVRFRVAENPRGPRAVDVEPLEE